jgi:S1/P1 Nuclease
MTTHRSKLASKFAALICVVLLLTSNSLAFWGPQGHRIVAALADERLSASARQQIRALLGNRDLPAVANYADQVRNDRPETRMWHFVDISIQENGQDRYDAGRDCKASKQGDCIVAELARARAEVLDTSLPKSKRADSLKFIVHLIGDLHQPLHCADKDDRGGNSVKVQWFGSPSNLHRVWDSDIIQKKGLSEKDYVAQLDDWLDSQDQKALAKGNVTDWMMESHQLAREHAYVDVASDLGSDYFDANESVIDEQLAKGGVRLAKFLNDMFSPQGGTPKKHIKTTRR